MTVAAVVVAVIEEVSVATLHNSGASNSRKKQQVMEEVTKGKLFQLASTTAGIGQTSCWI